MASDKPIRPRKKPGPQPRLTGAYTVSINLEDKHRLMLKIYARTHPEMTSDSATIRRAVEYLCADITDEQIQAERDAEDA